MYIKCVACLTTTDAEHFPLSAVLPDYFKTNFSILELLEMVTSTSVSIYISPNSLCSACLKRLKECYNFIQEFKKSQVWLEENLTKEMPDNQTVEIEDDEMGNDNLEEIILQVECKEEKEPEFKTELVKVEVAPQYKMLDGNISKIVNKAPVQNKIVTHTDHTYPRKYKKKEKLPIAPKKLRELRPKGVFVIPLADMLNSTTKPKLILPSEIKEEKEKELEPGSIVMSVIDVLNSKKTKKKISSGAKIKTVKVKAEEEIKREEEEELPFVCDLCNNMYASEKSLKGHKKRIHNPDAQKRLRCKDCGLQCRTRSALAHHSRTHKGEELKCNKCEKVCSTIGQLKYHKMVAHGPEDYLCNHCGERFSYARALTFHEVTVHQIGDKPFMCRYCGFRCLQRGHIKRHERCHTDERPFKCKFKSCDRTFRGKSEMHAHHRVHEGVRTLECKYCGKMFFRMWNMKLHWLQHVGNYRCTVCSKSFVDEEVLTFHYFHRHKIRTQGEEKDEGEFVENNEDGEYGQENLGGNLDLKYIMQSYEDNNY